MIVPLNSLSGGGQLDGLLANFKPLVVTNTIYQTELHDTANTEFFADCLYVASPANDATIVSTLIPALAQAIGVPSIVHYSVSALV